MSVKHFQATFACAALACAAAIVANPAPSGPSAPVAPLPSPAPGPAAASPAAIAPAARPFSLRVAGIESDLPILARFVEPGQIVEVAVVPGTGTGPFAARARGGALESAGPGRWRFLAPGAPGPAAIEVEDLGGHLKLAAPVFVLTPYRGELEIGGFRIGGYPLEPFRNLDAYRRPAGLVAVGPAEAGLAVSPHFQLGQFRCKQDASRPGGVSYVALHSQLLLALEKLLAGARKAGIAAETFTVMSGYRTPFYNAAIGNETIFSRHTYGDAADVYVDRDGDDRMDDLDGNGRIDAGDAQLLFDLAAKLSGREVPAGGLGLYGPKPHRGPFLHIDTRGYAARWKS